MSSSPAEPLARFASNIAEEAVARGSAEEASLTVTRRSYTLPLRLVDTLAGWVQALGAPIGRFDEDALVEGARRATGLYDFGEDAFRVPLRHLLEIVRGVQLTALARVAVRSTLLKALTNRLQAIAYLKQHPQVLEHRIERPIFILGFPRTGTTLIQNLLALSPAHRALQFWELQNPVPLHPDPAIDRAKRLRIGELTLKVAYFAAPEMEYIHAIRATTHEECWPLFTTTFAVLNYDLSSGFSEFGDWLVHQDMRGPYAEYKRMLQILVHQQPDRNLVLKCPEHLWFVDSILDVFPDARIIWTHRDPVASVASYSSLVSMNRRLLYGGFEPEAIGRHIQARFREGVDRAMDARDRSGKPDQFFDVDFRSLVKDTPATLRRLKAWLGIPHGPHEEAIMRSFLGEERVDKRGAHKYSPSTFGLDPAQVHAEYARYIERFQIPVLRSP
jgi:hypothetical protein